MYVAEHGEKGKWMKVNVIQGKREMKGHTTHGKGMDT